MDDFFHFLIVQVHFAFCQLNFIMLFLFLIKFYQITFIIIVFVLGCDRKLGLLLFVPALLLSILTPVFLPSSSVSLSYFVLAVPMRECLGKHSCMSSPFPVAILNATVLFSWGEILCLGRSFVHQNQIQLVGNIKLLNWYKEELDRIEIWIIIILVISGEGGWFVIFWIFKSILFFVNWISLYFFHFL